MRSNGNKINRVEKLANGSVQTAKMEGALVAAANSRIIFSANLVSVFWLIAENKLSKL